MTKAMEEILSAAESKRMEGRLVVSWQTDHAHVIPSGRLDDILSELADLISLHGASGWYIDVSRELARDEKEALKHHLLDKGWLLGFESEGFLERLFGVKRTRISYKLSPFREIVHLH